MADVLTTMGYTQKSKSISMIVDLERCVIDQTAGFDDKTPIKWNDNPLNDWMIPLIGAFESTIEICSIYATTHANALKWHINLRHFSLYKQEKPVASITLSMHDNTTARIDNVGTSTPIAGQGIC